LLRGNGPVQRRAVSRVARILVWKNGVERRLVRSIGDAGIFEIRRAVVAADIATADGLIPSCPAPLTVDDAIANRHQRTLLHVSQLQRTLEPGSGIDTGRGSRDA